MPHSPSRPALLTLIPSLLMMACLLTGSLTSALAKEIDPDNCFVTVQLPGFFPGEHRKQTKRLVIYAERRGGEFVSALANSNINGRPTFNGALYPVDVSKWVLEKGHLSGPFSVTLALDPWMPADRKARVCQGEVDVTFGSPKNDKEIVSLKGTWKMSVEGDPEFAKAGGLEPTASGEAEGGISDVEAKLPDLSDVSFDLWLPDLIPGPDNAGIQRRRALSLGWKDGKAISVRVGDMGADNSIASYEEQELPSEMSVSPHGFHARTKLLLTTLEGEALTYDITLVGQKLANWLVGSWKAGITGEATTEEISGFFRGDLRKGAHIPEPVAKDERPAWVPVPGWKPIAPGEHPRLLFRAEDVPALRAKAQTPDGKRIVEQLRKVLGNDGESMPSIYSDEAPVNINTSGKKWPVGTFTLSHGAGFGMLYQLTGDKKYAELAKQSVTKVLEGQVDRDPRYSYRNPGTSFRLGYVLQSLALAYDFCYDAWPEDFRLKVVDAMQNLNVPEGAGKTVNTNLERMALAGGYPPGSNHYGAYLNAPAMAALVLRGDPGADNERLDKILATTEQSLQKQLGSGFGDGGWFAEGTSCGRISSNGGILPMVQSLRVAAGKDYASPRPHARATVLRIMNELIQTGGAPILPHRGGYGDDTFQVRGLSSMGDFSQGMGAVLPEEAQAMRWIYENTVEKTDSPVVYDAVLYPHLAVYALVNWPDKATDPDKVLPRTVVDNVHGYYVTRNRWQDGDDIVVTTNLKRGPGGYKAGEVKTGTKIYGLGARLSLGSLSGRSTLFEKSEDGSFILADAGGNALAVDFSKSAGVDALIAVLGEVPAPENLPKVASQSTVDVGGTKVTVLTLSKGEHPPVVVDGNTVKIGNQVITVADKKLSLKTLPASSGAGL